MKHKWAKPSYYIIIINITWIGKNRFVLVFYIKISVEKNLHQSNALSSESQTIFDVPTFGGSLLCAGFINKRSLDLISTFGGSSLSELYVK